MRRIVGGLVPMLLALSAAPAQGQYSYNLSFEPYGGAHFDAYRNDGGSDSPGWIGGVRFGYDIGFALAGSQRALRIVLDGARAQTSEAGGAVVGESIDVLFRNEWWFLTGGIEWDVLPGWTGASLDARGGMSWLQQEITHASEPIDGGTTPGTTESAGHESAPVVAAGLSILHHLTPTMQVRLRAEDLWIDPGGDAEHSPVLALALRIMFR